MTLGRVVAGVMALWCVALATVHLSHQSFVYRPRPYRLEPATLVAHEAESAQMGVEELHYGTAEGLQIAYHVPTPERTNPFRDGASHDGAAHVDASGDRSNSDQASPSHSPPVVRGRLWLFFNGNAALARDWLPIVRAHRTRYRDSVSPPDSDAEFLLIDYPGYGHSEGLPSPVAIRESVDTALARLAAVKSQTAAEFLQRHSIGIVAYSLGCGAALGWAATSPIAANIDRVILIAPFTSIRDMVRQVLGFPVPFVGHVLDHEFDNTASLGQFLDRRLAQSPPPLPPLPAPVHDAPLCMTDPCGGAARPTCLTWELCHHSRVDQVWMHRVDASEQSATVVEDAAAHESAVAFWLSPPSPPLPIDIHLYYASGDQVTPIGMPTALYRQCERYTLPLDPALPGDTPNRVACSLTRLNANHGTVVDAARDSMLRAMSATE